MQERAVSRAFPEQAGRELRRVRPQAPRLAMGLFDVRGFVPGTQHPTFRKADSLPTVSASPTQRSSLFSLVHHLFNCNGSFE